MEALVLAIFGLFLFAGCTKSPVLTPIQQAGCAIETAVSGGIAGAVSSSLQCSHPDVVAADLQKAFGNANLCQAASVKLKPEGTIGDLACPAAIQIVVGFLSNSIPSTWGCSGPNATMQGLIDVATNACKAAVPVLH